MKKLIPIIFILAIIQGLTFYTIGKRNLIDALGKNYSSYVMGYSNNTFNKIIVVSPINTTERQIADAFNKFNSEDLKLCSSISSCQEKIESSYDYLYYFEIDALNPFTINYLKEGELAEDYGANWTSKYVWILYRWVLVEKENTGIS